MDSTILVQDLTAEERDAYSDTTQAVPDPVDPTTVVAAWVVVGAAVVEVEEAERVAVTNVDELVDEMVEAAAVVVAALVATAVVCANPDCNSLGIGFVAPVIKDLLLIQQ